MARASAIAAAAADGTGCRHRVPCVPRVGVSRRRRRTREPIRCAAGQALALRRAIQELGRRGLWRPGVGLRLHPMPLQRPRPRRHRQPTVAARPNPAAGSAERADRVRIGRRGVDLGPSSDGGSGGDGARGGLGSIPAPRACAASRRAQSWNVGQTGNALDRQYASWCATARGAGGDSAKQRCRWSGLVDRPSRSSPKATNGQAGAPSMLGSPRSVIRAMIPGPLASNAPGELAHCLSSGRVSCSPLASP